MHIEIVSHSCRLLVICVMRLRNEVAVSGSKVANDRSHHCCQKWPQVVSFAKAALVLCYADNHCCQKMMGVSLVLVTVRCCSRVPAGRRKLWLEFGCDTVRGGVVGCGTRATDPGGWCGCGVTPRAIYWPWLVVILRADYIQPVCLHVAGNALWSEYPDP